MEFLWFILIGLAAGWLAGQVMKRGGFGVLGDIVVGVIAHCLAVSYSAPSECQSARGLLGSLIVATIGAIVLLFVLRLVRRA